MNAMRSPDSDAMTINKKGLSERDISTQNITAAIQ